MAIHPSAVVSPQAEIDGDVSIGACAVIRGQVHISSGTIIENHVTIGSEHGIVEIGKNNHFLPGCVVGGPPQDHSYKGDETRLTIGERNQIREFVTINVGTVKGGGVTRVGSDNMLMAYSHVAHDCQLGDRIDVANACQFAGHVVIEDDVKIGGGCLVNQFVTLGRFAYIAGDSTINKDILPFTMAQGNYALCRATNKVGLERGGFAKASVENIHRAIRYLIKGDRTIEEAFVKIEQECEISPEIHQLINFVKNSSRGIAR